MYIYIYIFDMLPYHRTTTLLYVTPLFQRAHVDVLNNKNTFCYLTQLFIPYTNCFRQGIINFSLHVESTRMFVKQS